MRVTESGKMGTRESSKFGSKKTANFGEGHNKKSLVLSKEGKRA